MNRSALKRRQLLELLGIGAGSSACAMLLPQLEARSSGKAAGNAALPFVPVRAPLPLPADGLSAADQRRIYRTFNVDDKLLVPRAIAPSCSLFGGILSPRVALASTTTTWRSSPCLAAGPC